MAAFNTSTNTRASASASVADDSGWTQVGKKKSPIVKSSSSSSAVSSTVSSTAYSTRGDRYGDRYVDRHVDRKSLTSSSDQYMDRYSKPNRKAGSNIDGSDRSIRGRGYHGSQYSHGSSSHGSQAHRVSPTPHESQSSRSVVKSQTTPSFSDNYRGVSRSRSNSGITRSNSYSKEGEPHKDFRDLRKRQKWFTDNLSTMTIDKVDQYFVEYNAPRGVDKNESIIAVKGEFRRLIAKHSKTDTHVDIWTHMLTHDNWKCLREKAGRYAFGDDFQVIFTLIWNEDAPVDIKVKMIEIYIDTFQTNFSNYKNNKGETVMDSLNTFISEYKRDEEERDMIARVLLGKTNKQVTKIIKNNFSKDLMTEGVISDIIMCINEKPGYTVTLLVKLSVQRKVSNEFSKPYMFNILWLKCILSRLPNSQEILDMFIRKLVDIGFKNTLNFSDSSNMMCLGVDDSVDDDDKPRYMRAKNAAKIFGELYRQGLLSHNWSEYFVSLCSNNNDDPGDLEGLPGLDSSKRVVLFCQFLMQQQVYATKSDLVFNNRDLPEFVKPIFAHHLACHNNGVSRYLWNKITGMAIKIIEVGTVSDRVKITFESLITRLVQSIFKRKYMEVEVIGSLRLPKRKGRQHNECNSPCPLFTSGYTSSSSLLSSSDSYSHTHVPEMSPTLASSSSSTTPSELFFDEGDDKLAPFDCLAKLEPKIKAQIERCDNPTDVAIEMLEQLFDMDMAPKNFGVILESVLTRSLLSVDVNDIQLYVNNSKNMFRIGLITPVLDAVIGARLIMLQNKDMPGYDSPVLRASTESLYSSSPCTSSSDLSASEASPSLSYESLYEGLPNFFETSRNSLPIDDQFGKVIMIVDNHSSVSPDLLCGKILLDLFGKRPLDDITKLLDKLRFRFGSDGIKKAASKLVGSDELEELGLSREKQLIFDSLC